MKHIITSIILLNCYLLHAQKTYVPDNNFEQALIDAGYDDALDDSVLTATISAVSSLYLENKNISDLTGIEDFSNLSYLRAYSNGLTSIDVSNNLLLTYLNFNSNDLTTLDVSNNPLLTELHVSSNGLTTMDVSSNDSLTHLYLESNSLASITGLSNNTSLTYLRLKYNELTSLDLSGCTSLRDPQVYGNNLSSLDLTGCTEIVQLSASNNELTTLDLSTNDSLVTLVLEGNDLTSIDVTDKPNLAYLRAHSNDLSVLDLSFNPDMYYIHTTGNDSLSCIYVADPAYAQANWQINIDSWTSLCQGTILHTSGCTDPYAANYDSTAYFNDGSCVYPDNGEFSLNFDGVNDYVGIDTSLLNNVSQFTMAGWLKSDTGGNRKGFFGQNNLIEFGYQNDTTMWGWTASGGDVYWSIDSTFSFNSKHYAVLVGTGSSLMIYIDGELKSTDGSTTTSYNTSTYDFNIGGGGVFDANGNWFDGNIYEVAVWDTALSAAAIVGLYNSSAGLNPLSNSGDYISSADLLGYWKFDAGSGDTLFDPVSYTHLTLPTNREV